MPFDRTAWAIRTLLLASAMAHSSAFAGSSTTTTLVAVPNETTHGQPVTFTASVTGRGGTEPTGDVTFSDGTVALGNATLRTLGMGHPVAARAHSCAITIVGALKCWGLNNRGQLGNGTTTDSSTPVPVTGLTKGVASVVTGSDFTCALTTAGGVKCWGLNGYGELGVNSRLDSWVPVDVSGLTSGVVAIAAGGNHACAVTSGGGMKCWGGNTEGELGNNSTSDSLVPTNVARLKTGVRAITAGIMHTCALTASGGVKCWGWNAYGQLGTNSNTERHLPTAVFGLSKGIATISAGLYHTCAVTTSGAVKCWGFSLGSGQTEDTNIPTDVAGLNGGIAAVAGGFWHSCALTVGGGVKCWGANNYGQLGDGGSQASVTQPVDVIGLQSGVVAVASGINHVCALTDGGGVKCWGSNSQGQLGDNSTVDKSKPVAARSLAGTMYGKAIFTTKALKVGTHKITADYPGDGTYTGSGSRTLIQKVTKAPAALVVESDDHRSE
jgi:alpha-tubulin suppressor-like RCC1 family protein